MHEPKPDQGLELAHLILRANGGTGHGVEVHADFRVGARERVALVAPSGAGKSTVLKAIAGIPNGFEQISGQITLAGRDLATVPIQNRGIAYVMQELHLFSQLSVRENAEFALRVRKVPDSIRREKAIHALKRVGLGRHLDASVATLSGGERQRLALVRALIAAPELILLDEPFSALDVENRNLCLKQLEEFWSEVRCPMLFVTHDAANLEPEGRKFFDRTVTLSRLSLAPPAKSR